MPIQTIYWQDSKVKLIDQTRLPLELLYLEIDDYQALCDAIKKLQVRGAPAIGIAGAFGVVLGLQNLRNITYSDFILQAEKVIAAIVNTRPTAVTLFCALERMKNVIVSNSDKSIELIKQQLLQQALAILEEDKKICRAIGQYGASLINDNDTVL